jgi:eukaryotic-like serine/threonine-protein kinase
VPDLITRLQTGLADRYRIDRELGRGGMATVYLAQDLKHRRQVALKVLHPHLAHALGPERFLREIETAASLTHPHLVPLFDSGTAGEGLVWYTMPYIEGESLRDRLRRERQLPIADAVRIATEVAEALGYAHEHGVIHRDIKPENILLAGSHALVADFGIARALTAAGGERLTETGLTVGTPPYMSPEQAAGDRELDARSDLYSLGCVLYEMLAGEPPFTGPTAQAVIAKRFTAPIPPLRAARDTVPAWLQSTVEKSLAKVPGDRFSSAAQFAAALQAVAPTAGTSAVSRPLSRRPVALVAAAVGLLLLMFGGYAAFRGRATPAPPLASAAVLPFVDLSPGKDQEYFSDGLTEELITALSQVPGLRVAARTSSFQFKGQNPDVRDVGKKLDVGAVLEGSVRRSGDRLRVSTQLISVKDGYQLWSESYDRDLADVFAVQESVARSIVAALRVKLAPARDSALGVRATHNLNAYDLYLKGRFAWNQRTGESLEEAVRYLEQAVAADPGFAKAWGALADAYLLVVPYSGHGSAAEAWRKTQAAARRALALDPRSAEAYTALAYGYNIYGWDWAAADSNFRRAIAADSSYPLAHHWYGDLLAGRGRLTESLAEMKRAHTLDPLAQQIGVELGWVYYLMHRYDEAEAQIRQVLELNPNYAQGRFRLGLVEVQLGRYPEAIASFKRSIDLGSFYPASVAGLAAAYAKSGDRRTALDMVDDLKRRRAEGELVPSVHIAMAYGAVGDVEQGLAWLNRGIDERDIYIPENFLDPLLDPLRKGPGYQQVLVRMGLR